MKITRGIVIVASAAAILFTSALPAQAAPTTVRVSVGAGSPGAEANDFNLDAAVSADGRYVAFSSYATNLVTGDTNATEDIFVRDTVNKTTRRASVGSGNPGTQGACEAGRNPCNGARRAAISNDGRYVAFESDFANLVAGDTNKTYDFFVRDMVGNTTTRVSVTNAGAQTFAKNFSRGYASISADGKRVAFITDAREYVNESAFTYDVFMRDTAAKTTTLVTVTTSGGPNKDVNADPIGTVISGDGRLVGFTSSTKQWVPNDTNTGYDVFLRNLAAATTTRVNVGAGGAQPNGSSELGSMSHNGGVIGFVSSATNLITGDTNGKVDAYIRKGTQTIRVSVSSSGAQANNQAICAKVSGDGRYVAFCSSATNLVSGDTNGKVDSFWRDTQTGTTRRVSVSTAGAQGNNISPWPVISANGKFVAYESDATTLGPGDTSSLRDIYLSGPLF